MGRERRDKFKVANLVAFFWRQVANKLAGGGRCWYSRAESGQIRPLRPAGVDPPSVLTARKACRMEARARTGGSLGAVSAGGAGVGPWQSDQEHFRAYAAKVQRRPAEPGQPEPCIASVLPAGRPGRLWPASRPATGLAHSVHLRGRRQSRRAEIMMAEKCATTITTTTTTTTTSRRTKSAGSLSLPVSAGSRATLRAGPDHES